MKNNFITLLYFLPDFIPVTKYGFGDGANNHDNNLLPHLSANTNNNTVKIKKQNFATAELDIKNQLHPKHTYCF